MPNMDDVWLPIMHSAMDPRTAGGPLVGPPVDLEPSQPERESTSQPWWLFTVFPNYYMETGAKVDRSDATVTRTHSHRIDYEFYKNKVESTK